MEDGERRGRKEREKRLDEMRHSLILPKLFSPLLKITQLIKVRSHGESQGFKHMSIGGRRGSFTWTIMTAME